MEPADYDVPRFYPRPTVHRSRTERPCAACRHKIAAGDRYERHFSVEDDGKVHVMRLHYPECPPDPMKEPDDYDYEADDFAFDAAREAACVGTRGRD